jgi:MFS family permease
MIAIPWYFIDIIKKGSLYGILFATITFIALFWTLYAGTLIDRFNRKKIFLVINLLGFIVLTGFGLYGVFMNGVEVWMVGAIFMFSIMVFNIHYPTVYAFSQEIMEPAHYGRVSSMIEVQGQSSSVFAGAIAVLLLGGTVGKLQWLSALIGFEIEPWEIYEIFLLDGFTYLIALVIIYSIKYTSLSKHQYVKESLKTRFKEGLDFLKANKAIMWFGLLSFTVFIVTIVEGFYLGAIYVSDYLMEDAVVYTSAEMLYAAGALIAGIFIRRIFRKLNPIHSLLIIFIFLSIGFFICGITRSSLIFILFSFLLGLSNAGTRVIRITYLFQLVPNKIIGRVNGIFASYQTLMRGLFILFFTLPFFLKEQNIRIPFILFGLFLLISGFLLYKLTRKL